MACAVTSANDLWKRIRNSDTGEDEANKLYKQVCEKQYEAIKNGDIPTLEALWTGWYGGRDCPCFSNDLIHALEHGDLKMIKFVLSAAFSWNTFNGPLCGGVIEYPGMLSDIIEMCEKFNRPKEIVGFFKSLSGFATSLAEIYNGLASYKELVSVLGTKKDVDTLDEINLRILSYSQQ